MSMTTRCPQCGTTFRVVPDQLRVRNGLVRCGACSTVFDGRACLIAQIPAGFERPASTPASTAPPVAPAVTAPPREPDRSPAPAVLRGRADISKQDRYQTASAVHDDEEDAYEGTEPRIGPGIYDDDEPRIGARFYADPAELRAGGGFHDEADIPRAGAAFQDDDAGEPRLRAGFRDGGANASPEYDDDDDRDAGPPVVVGEARTRYHGETDAGRTPPEFLDVAHQVRRSFVRSLWGYACVLGILVLAAQLLYVYRTAIADMAPELRPLLVHLCDAVGCEVGYARHIDRISITSSSLQPPSGQAGVAEHDVNKLVLRASLRNLYTQPQPWPALRLDLSDMSDTVVIRKILLPEDYLPKGQAQRPFEAGAELNIAVPIEIKGTHVTGFQLNKFFP